MDWKDGLKGGPFSEQQITQLLNVMSDLDAGQLQWLCGYMAGASQAIRQESAVKETGKFSPCLVEESATDPVWVVYGTHTGNSERLAEYTVKKAHEYGLKTQVSDMGRFKPRDLKKIKNLLVIVSTHGIGEPPVQAEALHAFLHSKKAPPLKQLAYSVLALGDTSYAHFCQTGKEFDQALEKLGGEKIHPRVDCDVDFEEEATKWIEEALKKFQAPLPSLSALQVNGTSPEVDQSTNKAGYSRKKPFEAAVLDKINLNGRGSRKETLHFELSLEGSGLTYQPGDALGIYANNPSYLMEEVLTAMQFSGTEEVETYQGQKSLQAALTTDYELTVLTPFTLTRYAELSGSRKLSKVLEDNQEVQAYLYGRDIVDLIREVPCKLSPQQLIAVLRKNTPRMYSIASSQDAYEDEVHLLVSVVRYEAFGRRKHGQCSSFLADQITEEEKVKVFVDRNTRFKLPQDHQTPIIMVGPGTGVAPFRAFMQQREIQESRGKSWLFFGDQHFTTDFLYQTEWQHYLKEGILTRADVAFSRDQEEKQYVQHRLMESGRDVFQWLEEGAHFYVCGDAQRMAKDVHKTLQEIVKVQGAMTREKASEYVKYLQVSDRYQTDVY
uniref:assimilatory sulfite reductase (NADPH) n=1 Tax=Roseihalotalea indica TaxID=2867963 RepID=A0AA49GH50_9BACT|nr:assimilatory sulfite reductase (NADPH) flavoprotein subunit [Tunicatimonas sp. TK19036]